MIVHQHEILKAGQAAISLLIVADTAAEVAGVAFFCLVIIIASHFAGELALVIHCELIVIQTLHASLVTLAAQAIFCLANDLAVVVGELIVLYALCAHTRTIAPAALRLTRFADPVLRVDKLICLADVSLAG